MVTITNIEQAYNQCRKDREFAIRLDNGEGKQHPCRHCPVLQGIGYQLNITLAKCYPQLPVDARIFPRELIKVTFAVAAHILANPPEQLTKLLADAKPHCGLSSNTIARAKNTFQ